MSAEYLSTLFSLAGRTAFVTGGSSGIGLGIARALAQAGARVILGARRTLPLAQAVDDLTAHGHDAHYVVCDLGTRAGARAAADEVAERFDAPDILVNAAGINLRPPMSELSEQDWDLTMQTNLEAPHLLAQRFAPVMIDRAYGRIINISSQQAQRAFVTSGAYGASKAGLEGLTRSQAEAWSRYGVTANALIPGFVLTPLNARLQADPAQIEALAKRTMVGRNGVPDDFAAAAVFLAGAGSAYVTGQSIAVDGGFSVH